MAHPIALAFRILKEGNGCFESAHRAAIGAMEGTPYADNYGAGEPDDWTQEIETPEGLRQFLEHEMKELLAEEGPPRDLGLRFSEILTNWDHCNEAQGSGGITPMDEPPLPDEEYPDDWYESGWRDIRLD